MPLLPLLLMLLQRRHRRVRPPSRQGPCSPRHRRLLQHGQATTEYALVLLGAAAIALLLVAWATKTGAFSSLLDAVMDSIKQKV